MIYKKLTANNLMETYIILQPQFQLYLNDKRDKQIRGGVETERGGGQDKE